MDDQKKLEQELARKVLEFADRTGLRVVGVQIFWQDLEHAIKSRTEEVVVQVSTKT